MRKQRTNNIQRDYRVRQETVVAALRWLQAHNPYYRNITISQENIAELPIDGVPATLPELDDNDGDGGWPEESPIREGGPIGDGGGPVGGRGGPVSSGGGLVGEVEQHGGSIFTAVENHGSYLNEVERIARTVGGNAEPLEWPRRGQEPVNEYSHVGPFT